MEADRGATLRLRLRDAASLVRDLATLLAPIGAVAAWFAQLPALAVSLLGVSVVVGALTLRRFLFPSEPKSDGLGTGSSAQRAARREVRTELRWLGYGVEEALREGTYRGSDALRTPAFRQHGPLIEETLPLTTTDAVWDAYRHLEALPMGASPPGEMTKREIRRAQYALTLVWKAIKLLEEDQPGEGPMPKWFTGPTNSRAA